MVISGRGAMMFHLMARANVPSTEQEHSQCCQMEVGTLEQVGAKSARVFIGLPSVHGCLEIQQIRHRVGILKKR